MTAAVSPPIPPSKAAGIQISGINRSAEMEKRVNQLNFEGRIEAAAINEKAAIKAAQLRMRFNGCTRFVPRYGSSPRRNETEVLKNLTKTMPAAENKKAAGKFYEITEKKAAAWRF